MALNSNSPALLQAVIFIIDESDDLSKVTVAPSANKELFNKTLPFKLYPLCAYEKEYKITMTPVKRNRAKSFINQGSVKLLYVC